MFNNFIIYIKNVLLVTLLTVLLYRKKKNHYDFTTILLILLLLKLLYTKQMEIRDKNNYVNVHSIIYYNIM